MISGFLYLHQAKKSYPRELADHGGELTPVARAISPSTNSATNRNKPTAEIVINAWAMRVVKESGGLSRSAFVTTKATARREVEVC
jgi:hypothetical protein